MIHSEFTGPFFRTVRKKECVIVILLVLSSTFVLYFMLKSADENVSTNEGEKCNKFVSNKISLRERMLEHLSFTDIMQIFMIDYSEKKLIKDKIKVTENQKQQQRIKSKENIKGSERILTNAQLVNCVAIILLIYIFVNIIIDTMCTDEYRKETFAEYRQATYDEYGNKIDGFARRWSLADYASMKQSKNNSEFIPSRNKRVYSGGHKRPLLKYQSVGTNYSTYSSGGMVDSYGRLTPPSYSGIRRDSYGRISPPSYSAMGRDSYGRVSPPSYSAMRRDSYGRTSPPSYSGMRRDSSNIDTSLSASTFSPVFREPTVNGFGSHATGYEVPASPMVARGGLLGARPPALIRRSSFPVGPSTTGPCYGLVRQGSGDSGDSSPDTTRRRIRMLRRR